MSKINDIKNAIQHNITEVYSVIEYLNLSKDEKIDVMDTAEVICDKLDNLKSTDINYDILSLMK
jgi:hypothetical protein